jgi:hypothetical protein
MSKIENDERVQELKLKEELKVAMQSKSKLEIFMLEKGYRPLTYRDGLFWERLALPLITSIAWCLLAWFALSQLYDPGFGTLFVLFCLGLMSFERLLTDFETSFEQLKDWPKQNTGT